MKPAVVVGYDRRPHSEHAVDEAAAEAERRGGVLTVLHAFGGGPPAPEAGRQGVPGEAAREAALRVAEQGAEQARSRHPGLEVRTRAVQGPAEAVLRGSAPEADLLVIGCHPRASGLLLDSVAARVAAHPGCPTMIVHRRRHQSRGTVLVAIDIDDPAGPADEVLAFAFAEARLRQTGLKAVSVRERFWPPVYAGDTGGLRAASIQADDNAELALREMLLPWRSRFPGVHVRHELADGPAATILTAASPYADLVVLGAHRHRGGGSPVVDGHLGPTIHPVLLRADCPVVIVPRSPVPARSRARGVAPARHR